MKTCPECGIALKDEYQFCPEDGAPLDAAPDEARGADAAPSKPQAAGAVVLYCPACAAEYPLTFSECPVHHTALTTHGMPSLGDIRRDSNADEEAQVETTRSDRRLHLVPSEAAPRRPSLEAYEETLESLARPAAGETREAEEAAPVSALADDERKHRLAAIAISVALGVLALIGLYAVISNASRRPAPAAKTATAKNNSPQPSITVQTPPAASEYQSEAPANPHPSVDQNDVAPRGDADGASQSRPRRDKVEVSPSPTRAADARMPAPVSEPAAARRPQPAEMAQPAMVRQPAATELVLPRGTFGLVAARLTGMRAARTAHGYRYDLTFHMADQAGHATQWERLAIVTRSNSGATRQQQIPFFHRLGADGSLSFTVSVEMPGHAPADWQGRIICTSIGSDSSGKTYRASFGANVSPD